MNVLNEFSLFAVQLKAVTMELIRLVVSNCLTHLDSDFRSYRTKPPCENSVKLQFILPQQCEQSP